MSLTAIEQFAADLHQEVLVKMGDEANPSIREEAFTELVLELLAEHDETGGVELCTFEVRGSGRSPAAKVNAWALSADGATLDLFVTKYLGTGKPEQVSKPDARRHFDLVGAFLRRSLDGTHARMEESSAAFEVSRRIHEARDTLSPVPAFPSLVGGCSGYRRSSPQFFGRSSRTTRPFATEVFLSPCSRPSPIR